MIWSIAWRNLWRNKVRSTIVLSAVAVGLFAGIFSIGFYQGMADMRIKSAIKTETSHIQVHHSEYKINDDVALFMNNTGYKLNEISQVAGVDGASRRVISECMVSSAYGNLFVRAIGIEPEKEKLVTDIYDKVTEGNYFEDNTNRIPQIIIGESLAEELKLKIKSKLSLDLVDIDGNIMKKKYKVAGIFRTSNTGYDDATIFTLRTDLINQLNINEDASHEIAIYLKPDVDIDLLKAQVQSIVENDEVKIWKEISRELAMMTDSMDQLMYILVGIIMLALCFGIVNTMLMVVLERRKELGMLMAVGMKRIKVFYMIVIESVLLSLSGGIIGILIGYITIKIGEVHPIVLKSFEGFDQFGYQKEIYTSISTDKIISVAIMVVVLGVVSALYPARKATRLDPAEAIRTE